MSTHTKVIAYAALYLNNILIIGEMEAIYDNVEALKSNLLVLNVMDGLQDYLSSKIKFSEDKKRAWLGQPCLIKL